MITPSNSRIQVLSFFWEFSKDGGAIGSQSTNVVFPKNSTPVFSFISILEEAETAGVAGNWRVGNAGDPDAYSLAYAPQVLWPVGFAQIANPLQNSTADTPVLFEIAGDQFIRGKIKFCMIYISTA